MTQEAGRSELAELAAQHGLVRVGGRPSLPTYVRTIWERRAFLWTMASSRSYSKNQNNYLGQLWAVLSPMTLAGVYYLVFAVMLDTTGGIENFVAFLVIGIFIFQAIATTITSGSTAITSNTNLVRALEFPRAILPISVAISEVLNLLPALGVMIVIVLLSGEPVSWYWLLLPVATLLLLLFSSGFAMIAARLVVGARDLRNLIPVAVRLLRYVSGVFFLISESGLREPFISVMEYQPVALYLTLIRSCVMAEFPPEPELWLWGTAWALATVVIGFLVFWSAEDRYGRD